MRSWKKRVYIASKIGIEFDDEGNQVIKYSEPKMYEFNVQPISSEIDLMEFGEKASMIQKAVIPIKYKHCFKENDVAYLDDISPMGENNFGDNANYKLYPPRNQNKVIIIYFERLTGK